MITTLFNGQLPKAVFFDLDGTLIDSVPDISCAVDKMLLDLGFAEAGESKIRGWVGNGARVLVLRALAESLQIREEDVEASQLDSAHKVFVKHYAEQSTKNSKVYKGVKTVLRQLQRHGVRMAVITNKPAQFTPGILTELGLSKYFEVTVSGDSLPLKKPDPAPLIHVLTAMNLPVEVCLMVGDSSSDITAANAAGMQSVCVTYGYNHGEDPRELPATAHIDQFLELLA